MSIIDTPIGPMTIHVDAHGRLTRLHFGTEGADALVGDGESDVATQLAEYFAGRRRTFDLEVAPSGTPFQLDVWTALREIPYGETIPYVELARRIGRPKSVRAVGAANGANPIPIVIPCHRVIGADGTLTGYGGGIEKKQWLLALEGGRDRTYRTSRTNRTYRENGSVSVSVSSRGRGERVEDGGLRIHILPRNRGTFLVT